MEISLKIDSEFKSLIPPITAEEYQQLEENILKDGCRDVIVLWQGIIIDGHNRYEICRQHDRFFKTTEKSDLKSRDEAKEWIIRNQFGRRNLSAYDRSKLALQLEEFIQVKAKENQQKSGGAVPQKSAEPVETRKEIAKIAGVSHDTIDKVKVIEKEATSEQKAQLSTGETKINTVFTDIQRDKAVEKYPELEPIPKMEAIQAAKKIDQLPEPERVEIIKEIAEKKEIPPALKNPEIKGDISFMQEPGYLPPEERAKKDLVFNLFKLFTECRKIASSISNQWESFEETVKDVEYENLVYSLSEIIDITNKFEQWQTVINNEIKLRTQIRRVK